MGCLFCVGAYYPDFKVQWNLFITDTLVQDGLSVIKRCPLLGGWFKNASVTHIIMS